MTDALPRSRSAWSQLGRRVTAKLDRLAFSDELETSYDEANRLTYVARLADEVVVWLDESVLDVLPDFDVPDAWVCDFITDSMPEEPERLALKRRLALRARYWLRTGEAG